MIARHARIPRQDFLLYSQSRLQARGVYYTVVYTPGVENRGAVVVSKKVAKKAVDRNRLRRCAYATLASFWGTEPTLGAYVIYYKPGALKASRFVLKSELSELLARIIKPR